jgi:hypothetical protein
MKFGMMVKVMVKVVETMMLKVRQSAAESGIKSIGKCT